MGFEVTDVVTYSGSIRDNLRGGIDGELFPRDRELLFLPDIFVCRVNFR